MNDESTKTMDVCTFLIPSFATPLLVSETLYTAKESNKYDRCGFVLLLDRSDKALQVYVDLVKALHEDGFKVGYIIFDGTPYCGKVNRLSAMVNSRTVCVLGNKAILWEGEKQIAEYIEEHLAKMPQPMQVILPKNGESPIVSLPLVERLGYLYHPICFGKYDSEMWIKQLAIRLGIAQVAEGLSCLSSIAGGSDTIGGVSKEDAKWSMSVLNEILDAEVKRLGEYILG